MPTGNPTPRADPGPAGGVNTAACNTCKYLRAWRWMPFVCVTKHIRQPLSSFIYPQGRGVHVPTGNPTPHADPGPAGGVNTAACNTCKYLRAWRWMPFVCVTKHIQSTSE